MQFGSTLKTELACTLRLFCSPLASPVSHCKPIVVRAEHGPWRPQVRPRNGRPYSRQELASLGLWGAAPLACKPLGIYVTEEDQVLVEVSSLCFHPAWICSSEVWWAPCSLNLREWRVMGTLQLESTGVKSGGHPASGACSDHCVSWLCSLCLSNSQTPTSFHQERTQVLSAIFTEVRPVARNGLLHPGCIFRTFLGKNRLSWEAWKLCCFYLQLDKVSFFFAPMSLILIRVTLPLRKQVERWFACCFHCQKQGYLNGFLGK